MATVSLARRHDRLSTHLPATLVAGGRRVPVTLLSLSEGGFTCEGHGLEAVGPDLVLEATLTPQDALGWTPKSRTSEEGMRVTAPAELLFVDLPGRDPSAATPTQLGARFADLPEATAASIREFVALELFRRGEWRTRGGGIPLA